MANVQISQELFGLLCQYHLLGTREHSEEIRRGLQAKMDAIIRRSDYKVYSDKDASPQEREEARRRYLDSVGVPDAFRW